MHDAVHSFREPPVFFAEAYQFEGVIAVPSVHKRILVLNFTHITDGATVAVRSLPDSDATDQEMLVLHRLEEMRQRLGLACVVRLHGYCSSYEDLFEVHNDLLTPKQKQQLQQEDQECGLYWNVIMDYVPLAYNQLDKDYMSDDDGPVVAFLVDLLYTLWRARMSDQFSHGDLHINNIMFAPLAQDKRTRRYTVAGMRLTVHAAYLPVLIDFEKSKFGSADPKENMSDVRNAVTAMGHLMEEYGIAWSSEFMALRSHVLSFTFVDSRFMPDTIVRILRDFALFDGLREQAGGEETELKKIKGVRVLWQRAGGAGVQQVRGDAVLARVQPRSVEGQGGVPFRMKTRKSCRPS